MKEMKNMVSYMLNDGILGWIMLGVSTLVLVFILWGLFIAVDSVGINSEQQTLQVVSKKYSPAYTTVTMVSDGNGGMTPVTNYYPESWYIRVNYNNVILSCSVDGLTFNQVKTGGYVKAFVGSGRITNSSYCTGVETL